MSKEYRTILERGDYVTDFVANGSFKSLKDNVLYNRQEDYAILLRLVDYSNKFKGPFVYVNKHSYDFLKKSSVNTGDIIISNVGENVGTVFRAPDLNKPMTLGPNSILVRMRNESQAFWYYWFISGEGQFRLKSIVSSSAQPKFNKTSFRDLMVPTVDLDKQIIIGDFLSKLDDKIELNRKINAKLDQMVRILYDYWFIQFDFPDGEGKPYKSSGGQMAYSNVLKREIPSGWKALKLQDALEFDKGTEPGAAAYSDEQNAEFDLPFYRVGDIDGETDTYINTKKFNTKSVQPRDVIVTFDGSVGKMGLGLNGAISGGLRHIYDKTAKISDAGVYAIFSNDYITKTIERYATGSVILHASGSIPYLVIPYDENVFASFQKVIDPMYSKIIANRQQSKKLAHLRDWLLPMLMNGQVRVD